MIYCQPVRSSKLETHNSKLGIYLKLNYLYLQFGDSFIELHSGEKKEILPAVTSVSTPATGQLQQYQQGQYAC